MEFIHVEEGLIRALDFLIVNDEFLLINDVNERSISHKLAEYLQTEFIGWNVDCEYNRKMNGVKKISHKEVTSDDLEAKTVYPDIIIHRRNTEDNLLIIEIKKKASGPGMENDVTKINEFMKQLQYKHGVFINFEIGPGKAGIGQITWIE